MYGGFRGGGDTRQKAAKREQRMLRTARWNASMVPALLVERQRAHYTVLETAAFLGLASCWHEDA
jgi:hypothetical protein